MEGTTDFHDLIACAVAAQPTDFFDDSTAFDAADDMLNPHPPLGQCAIGRFLCGVNARWRGFLVGISMTTPTRVNPSNPKSCNR